MMSSDARTVAASMDAVMRHVHHFNDTTPFRKSGSGQDLQAARYVVETLNAYGLEAHLEEFETFDSDPGEASLEIVGPGGRPISARACAHIEPTPAEGYVGEIVDVGPGADADYRGRDVRGKIVLAEVSYAPATPEKARIAASKGAAGIVLMNWGQGDEPGVPWRALKAVWGNPTPESWNEIPRLFGVSISRRDGEAIRALLANGTVTMKAKVTAKREWRTVSQPIAWLHAPEESPERDKFVIVSGHIDSWSPGLTDNISGNSVMLEVARNLAAIRHKLRRSVVFCFWNGHEVAEAAGSAYFVDAHWEKINRDAVAYFNIDSVGMKGTSLMNVASCAELSSFVRGIAEGAMAGTVPVVVSNLTRVGDQSFFGVGVSAATGRHGFSPETVKRYNGATLGWYNHTEFDTLEQLDETVLSSDFTYWDRVVRELTTAAVLPHRFLPRVDDLADRMTRMLAGKEDPASLSAIPTAIAALRSRIVWFDGYMDALAAQKNAAERAVVRANGVVLRVARSLTFLSGSASGKYQQDSYGVSTLMLPVPFLSALDDYVAAAPGSLERKLLVTKLLRLRHVVTDALQSADDILADLQLSAGA
jgi:hypothetical protein